jgi:hypothetical protein
MARRKKPAYSRRIYRQELRRWVRRNWLLLTVCTACFVVPAAFLQLLLDGYVLGVAQGFMLGLLLLATTTSFLVHTSMAGQLGGAWGEELTRDELAKAKRRRLIWGWVDSIERNGADVDHLVVLRSGRVVAIDSKWRREAGDERRLDEDAEAAKRSARRAAAVLSELGSTKSVEALVVVWGAARSGVHGRRIRGVQFISGNKLRDWLRQQPGTECGPATAQALLGGLAAYRQVAAHPDS